MARTIQSPGVEINEIDLTLRPATVEGTSIFIAGFASQGPIDEVLQPTSISEFEQIYGSPRNAAERYFYHTVKNVVNNSPARITVSRLPYGEGRGDGFATWRYSALAYPVKAVETTLESISTYNITDYVVTANLSGGGYGVVPTIQVIGGGSSQEAVVTAVTAVDTVNGGVTVNRLIVTALGQYQTIPTKIITPSYFVTGVTLTSAGSGYISAPQVSFVGSTTLSAASGIANMVDDGTGGGTFKVSSVSITFKGNGYNNNSPINVVFTPTAGETNFVNASGTVTTVNSGVNIDFFGAGQQISNQYVVNNRALNQAKTYFIGKPSHIELSSEEYQSLIENNIDWKNNPAVTNQPFDFANLGESAIIVLNKAQTTVNNKFEGYYVGFADNNNYNPATEFNSVLNVDAVQTSTTTINNYTRVPSTRLNFNLSATKFGDGASVSEIMENLTQFDLNATSFNDTISFALFKLRQNIFSPDTISLDYVLNESYTGSLDYHRQIAQTNGGPAESFFLEKLSEGSNNIKMMINPYITNQFSDTWLNDEGIPTKKVRFLTEQLATPFNAAGNVDTLDSYVTRVGAPSGNVANYMSSFGKADSLFPVGIYTNTVASNKVIGNVPAKLDRVFELVENSDLYPIDIALEAGLGTVYVNGIEQNGGVEANGPFNDTTPLKALSGFYITNSEALDNEGLRIRSNYNSVANVFVRTAERQRKDFMVVLDPIRNIFVQGENSKIINAKKIWSPKAGNDPDPNASGYVTSNFSQHIYWPLRHQFGTINSSYAATYANWAQVIDPIINRQVWVPFSGFIGSNMANSDSNFQPWYAPAGFTRGVLVGVNDLALYPKQKQRDQLYKISLNPITFFPNEGFVIFGQKTMLKKPSAFDRINVRRLFLNLERATKDTVKFFVFEPNTLFTRTQVINVLAPLFENAKNTEGLYDYRIVCSELNNTPDIIDNNELRVDIYIQPVRVAEFILVNFYATRTGTNFDEIIGVRA